MDDGLISKDYFATNKGDEIYFCTLEVKKVVRRPLVSCCFQKFRISHYDRTSQSQIDLDRVYEGYIVGKWLKNCSINRFVLEVIPKKGEERIIAKCAVKERGKELWMFTIEDTSFLPKAAKKAARKD